MYVLRMLVKKIEWVRMKEKYKHLAKSNRHYHYASITKTKLKCNRAVFFPGGNGILYKKEDIDF